MGRLNKDLLVVESKSQDGTHTTVCLNAPRTLFVDVDRTLVFFPGEKGAPPGPIRDFKSLGTTHKLIPHEKHVEALKQFKARGHGVVVWSQGGGEWAQHVVEWLGLLPYVDLVMAKPDWILDDKKAVDWIGQRFYIDPITGKTEDFDDK